MDDETILIFGAVAAAGFALYKLTGTVDKIATPLSGVASGAGTIAREAGETVESVLNPIQAALNRLNEAISKNGGSRTNTSNEYNYFPNTVSEGYALGVKAGKSKQKSVLNLLNKGFQQAIVNKDTALAFAQIEVNPKYTLKDIGNTPRPTSTAAKTSSLSLLDSAAFGKNTNESAPINKVQSQTVLSSAAKSSPSIQTVSATKSVTKPSVGLKVGSSYTSGRGATVSVKGYTPAKKSTKPRAR